MKSQMFKPLAIVLMLVLVPLSIGTAQATQTNQGLRDDKDDKGQVGPQGPAGPVGLTGATGATGPAGPSGINTRPYLIGDTGPCGKVFYVTTDQLHGLEAETQDQGVATWFNAQDLISESANHSAAGKNCTDWRLPTKFELNLLHIKKDVVGGFANNPYWSSTEADSLNAWYQNFGAGDQNVTSNKGDSLPVRAVRAF